MAGIGIMLAGAIANATAFIGGNAIYHAVDAKNAGIERKRHNNALEKMNKEKNEWEEKRIKHLDYITRQREKTERPKSDFHQLDLDILTFEENNKKPVLDYTPSKSQKNYEKMYIAGSVLGSAAAMKTIF